MRSVALGLWVRTGSRNETPAQAGVSHFLEHLLFKGTARFSAIEIAEKLDGLGASVNAATGKETTHLHARFLDEHTEEVFDLLAEMLLAPTYPEIDSERDVVLEEIAMYEDEPQDRVHDILAGAVFGEHPLGRRVLGEAEVISSVPVPDIEAYRSAHYTGRKHRRRRRRQRRPRPDRRARRAAGLARRGAPTAASAHRRGGRGGAAALLREGHRAVPHLLRRAGDRPRRRASLRPRRARLDLRRLQLLAPLPRGAREARARLRGRLLQRAVHRLRPGRELRRHPRGQRRGGLLDHRRRAGAAAQRAGLARRSSTAPRRASRAASCSPRSRRRRGCRGSPARRSSTCRSTASTRCWPRSTPSASRTWPSLPRALRPRAPLRRLRRPRREPLPRGARPGQREPGGGMIRVAVSGAAGRMGQAVCEAVEGAADTELDRARPIPAPGHRAGRRARRRRRRRRLHHPRHRPGQRQGLPRGGRPRRRRHDRLRPRRAAPAAEASQANCFVAPNFAIGAVLLMEVAQTIAPHMPECEIVELHHDRKLDAPSGTAKRTAELISRRGRQRPPADPLGAAARPGRPPGGHLRRRGPDPEHPPRLDRPPLLHARRAAGGAQGRRPARPLHGRAGEAALTASRPIYRDTLAP